MKYLLTAAALLAAMSAQAAPNRSQHPQIGELSEVEFELNSAELPKASEQLGEAAGWAEHNPDGLLVLGGHADRSGDEMQNVELSLHRAEAVRDELVKLGVDPDQIVIVAYGAKGPQRANPSENRRVTIWATRQSIQRIVASSLEHGTVVVWSKLGRRGKASRIATYSNRGRRAGRSGGRARHDPLARSKGSKRVRDRRRVDLRTASSHPAP